MCIPIVKAKGKLPRLHVDHISLSPIVAGLLIENLIVHIEKDGGLSIELSGLVLHDEQTEDSTQATVRLEVRQIVRINELTLSVILVLRDVKGVHTDQCIESDSHLEVRIWHKVRFLDIDSLI